MPRIMLATMMLLAAIVPVRAADDDDAPRSRRLRDLVRHFDDNGDGRLTGAEREAALNFIREIRESEDMPAIEQTVFPGRTDLYKLEAGPHDVATIGTYALRDETRGKDILLRITYPKEGGPYPLVIFCHGALGSKDGAEPLAEHWTSHGYVVIRPTFGDSASLLTDSEKRGVRSIVELVNSSRVKSQWDDRPRDVRFIIDSLDMIENANPPMIGKIDHKTIAVSGHSFGAHTTMLLAGMTLYVPGTARGINFRDERISAAVMISPQGTSRSITRDSYATMAGPMLMITGDNDATPIREHAGKAGAWRREAFDHSPAASDTYLLWIKGAHHGFGGINGQMAFPTAGPLAPDHVYYVAGTALAFFDAYLRGDAAALAYLRSDKIGRETDGAAILTVRQPD